jgi:hypothetical protein
LIGFAYLFQRYQTEKSANTSTATIEPTSVPVQLYNLTGDQLEQINIEDNFGNEINFYRDSASPNWVIAGMPADQADSGQIDTIISQLLSIKIQETLTESVPFESIGFVPPAYKFSMTTSDGTQVFTFIGSPTAIGSGYYARLDSGPIVILEKSSLDAILDWLKNPPLKPTSTPESTPSETGTSVAPGEQATPAP